MLARRHIEWDIGSQSAVIPSEFACRQSQLGQVVAGGEAIGHLLCRWAAIGHQHRGAAENSRRRAKFQTCEGHSEDMVGHIAEGAGTEGPPAAEVPRRIYLIVGSHGSRTDEGFPVHGVGQCLYLLRRGHALRPDGAVGEGLYLRNLTNLTIPQPIQCLTCS